jgi:DNA-binding LacI/PurR family transcriptional regulator
MQPRRPSARDRVQIAARSESSPRTVDRCYAGHNVHDTTRARIEAAARDLGLPPPPVHSGDAA